MLLFANYQRYGMYNRKKTPILEKIAKGLLYDCSWQIFKSIDSRIGTSKIKIVTGLRRSGKSYLLNTIFTNYLLSKGVDKSHIIFIELDDEKNEYLLEKWMLREYIENIASDDNAQYYIILDEMENGNINKMKLILLRENMISNIYIQVVDKIPKYGHEENEYESLLSVPGSFKKLLVVNDNFIEYTNNDGILIISLEKFLLDYRSLDI